MIFQTGKRGGVYIGKLYRVLVRLNMEDLKIMKIKLGRIVQGTYKRNDITRDDYLS